MSLYVELFDMPVNVKDVKSLYGKCKEIITKLRPQNHNKHLIPIILNKLIINNILNMLKHSIKFTTVMMH